VAAREDYPRKHFEGFWERLEESIDNGIVSCFDVLEELDRKDDDLKKWARQRRGMFWDPTVDVQRITTRIMTALPNLVDVNRGRSMADPFVVAQASVLRAAVITQERRGSAKSPRIPEACDIEGLRCIRRVDLVIDSGWRFVSR
jgi:hypothetical protein